MKRALFILLIVAILAAAVMAGWTWDEDHARTLFDHGFRLLGPHDGSDI